MKNNRNTRKLKNNSRRYSKKRQALLRRRKIFYTVVISAAVIVIGYFMLSPISKAKSVDEAETTVKAPREFKTDTTLVFDGRYQVTFNDVQEVQIVAAETNGIQPLATPESIDSVVALGQLVEVPECALYEISEVSHPYLTPDTKQLLDEISKRYQSREKEVKQLRLTGCLRTDQTISRLMRRNRNSVKNSCHLYGTTFDISYRYLTQKEKRTLAQILYELQQAGHCYVKYERKQPCFHITIR